MFDKLKSAFITWLGIVPSETQQQIVIREYTTRESEVLRNKLWYRGDPSELEQYYKIAAGIGDGVSTAAATKFWAAVSDNILVRKMHSGLPRMIVDKLAGIVLEDMNELDADESIKSRWDEIAKDIKFDELLEDAIVRTLSEGDGAFKVCVDPDISNLPLVEFYSGNDVEFDYKRGKLVEIRFLTDYFQGQKQYRLIEYYGKGYVNYRLFNSQGVEVPMDTLEETETLQDVSFEGKYIMGVPLKFYNSAKYKNRGDSVYATKEDTFDAFDEVVSTWMDSLRAGRVKQYIPEPLLPRNPETGDPRKPDVFNPYHILQGELAEDVKGEVQVKQGNIEYEGLLISYTTLLDCALQGVISPSTLGIDVKKLDNAESQREKEKTTLYTRDKLIGALSKVLPKLVEIVLKTQDNLEKQAPPESYECTFTWGQYANPSFEAMVETVGKAKTYGIMSLEQAIDELYGDTKDKDWKKEELARLESVLQVDEPSLGDIGGGVNVI